MDWEGDEAGEVRWEFSQTMLCSQGVSTEIQKEVNGGIISLYLIFAFILYRYVVCNDKTPIFFVLT